MSRRADVRRDGRGEPAARRRRSPALPEIRESARPSPCASSTVHRRRVAAAHPARARRGGPDTRAAGVEKLSPPLDQLSTGLGPLAHASQSGLPALDDSLNELRPLLTHLSPVLRNLNPFIQYADLYQPEIEAAFANDAVIGEASAPTTNENPSSTALLHYVRGLAGPVSPGSLSLQTTRYGVDRANAYAAPGAFDRLESGLLTLEPSSCANPTPGVGGPPNATVSQDTLGLIEELGIDGAGSGAGVAAPPCAGQAAQSFGGLTSTFPHVVAAP